MELMDLATFLNDLANYYILIPIGVGLYYFKKLDHLLKGLTIGLSLMFFQLFALFNSSSAFISSCFLGGLDLIVYTYLLHKVYSSKTKRWFWLLAGASVLIFIIIDALFITKFKDFAISILVEKIFLVVLSLFVLNHQFKDNLEVEVFQQPVVWICSGLIIYNLFGSFDFFSLAVMNYSQNLILQYYVLWSLIKMVMYSFFAYSLILSSKRTL
jgi:hypothetical protein